MVVKLAVHEHGKGRVRLLKVTRTPERHEVLQLEAQILLEGAPAASAYYDGDNGSVLPTDSVKNTVYAVAKQHEFASLEDFGVALAKHFVTKHPAIVRSRYCCCWWFAGAYVACPQIDKAKVKLFETPWQRLELPDSKVMLVVC